MSVYVMARMLYKFIISSPSLAIAGKHGKRHAMPQAVSDWLNPHSLGTISAFGRACKFSLKFNLFKAKIYEISSDTHQLQFIKMHHFKQERF